MKLLIITENLFPKAGNNGNLIGKLIPYLAERHEVEILSIAFGQEEELPDRLFGVPVHWARDKKRDLKRRFLYPLISKIEDRGGYSDLLGSAVLSEAIRSLDSTANFDAFLTMSEPFISALAALPFPKQKKVLYIMDPPASLCGGEGTTYRNKMLPTLLRSQDLILSTPFILNALKKEGFSLAQTTETVGFPLITDNQMNGKICSDGVIRLLFCGWLYSDIRSPRYFLDIVSHLDERFEVTFMGRECETLGERFQIDTKAKIITLPQQPYETALQAMADADILINIGNSVPVHMPSKTLEYINTGKPMVNFYKFADCPTLYYTNRYPLALNLFEEEKNLDAAAKRFIRFCEDSLGKTVDHNWLKSEYADCTPQYIAQKILDFLEK